jgi:hypothetical protein
MMNIKMTIRGFKRPSEIRSYAEDRMADGLKRFDGTIRRVTARVEDETGPRKQVVDKVCMLHIELKHGGQVMIHELGDDLPSVIDVALDRAKAALSRKVAKKKRGVGAG